MWPAGMIEDVISQKYSMSDCAVARWKMSIVAPPLHPVPMVHTVKNESQN